MDRARWRTKNGFKGIEERAWLLVSNITLCIVLYWNNKIMEIRKKSTSVRCQHLFKKYILCKYKWLINLKVKYWLHDCITSKAALKRFSGTIPVNLSPILKHYSRAPKTKLFGLPISEVEKCPKSKHFCWVFRQKSSLDHFW